jgi:uncharacterized membrane protein YedE/YeeE
MSVLLVAVAGTAWLTGNWVLTALVIGFLFGFAMQRGGFCGSSILSLFVLEKDPRPMLGAGIAICVAMLGFALMAALGWVSPSPKGFALLPAIVGGAVFGVGMVLAGGCVSGSLFKAGEGRVGSMLALLGIGVGTNMAGPGLLGPTRKALVATTKDVTVQAGAADTLGVGYALLGTLVGVAGLSVAVVAYRRRGGSIAFPLRGRWSYASAGLFIGVLGWFAFLSSAASGRNYPLGVTHGVMALLSEVVGGQTPVKLWLALEVAAIVAGSAFAAWLLGELKLRSLDPSALIVAFLGGVLVGAGAVCGSGCFVGNVLSGWALLSWHSLLFGVVMILANWATTAVYLRGDLGAAR